MKREFMRRVVVFEEHFKDFRKTLDRETLKKMYQVLTLIMVVDVIPAKFLQSVKGRPGLYEIRLEYEGNIYRVFCCFDEGNLIILFNGFQKKTQKTPIEQIDMAEALMKRYFEQKNIQNDGTKGS